MTLLHSVVKMTLSSNVEGNTINMKQYNVKQLIIYIMFNYFFSYIGLMCHFSNIVLGIYDCVFVCVHTAHGTGYK